MIALAIVGTRVLAHPQDRFNAACRVLAAIGALRPDVVISGGAAGVDSIAEENARHLGYHDHENLIIHRPTVKRFHGPGGYRERDERIARECTHLLRIACSSATTYGSGWTADFAETAGKIVVRHILCGPEAGDYW